jgi:hypothetical protein
MERRCFLAAAAAGLGAGLTGCQTRQVSRNPAVLEDRPSHVYVPTHTDGMQHVQTVADGRLRFALSFARPHRFWLVTGTRTRRVSVEDDDSLHFMCSVWDAETGVGIPTSNATVTLTRADGSPVEKSLWSMLSQRMGVHFGDNVGLGDAGTFGIDLQYGPIEAALGGDLAGIDAGTRSVTTEFEYDPDTVASLGFEDLGDRAGRADAVEPMQMDMLPVSRLPPREDLPGTTLGAGLSGDAAVAGTVLDAPPDGVDGNGPYLAISPRTPYNRYPLPFASLSADDESLSAVVDSAVGFHYGRVLDVRPEAVEVTVDAPPQLARHEGYETAFVDMSPVTLGGD